MNRTTNVTRIRDYDNLKADRDTMQLVLFDLVNNRFTDKVTLDCQVYDKTLSKGTKLEMSASWRAMPIFLIHWIEQGVKFWTPYFMTETQLEDLSRHAETPTQRMLRDAWHTLMFNRAQVVLSPSAIQRGLHSQRH